MADSTLWSVTAATNASADPAINWAEGQAPGTVNDSARNMMAVHAMRWLDETGYAVSGGSSTAYTFTPQQTLTSYLDGLTIGFRAHTACGAAPTLNVSSLGAKSLKNRANGALAANDIASGAFVKAVYVTSLDVFLIVNQHAASELTSVLGGGGMPIGTMVDFAGSTAPSRWLLCYGQLVSRTTYSELFAVISTNYSPGDGSTTFGIPDLRGTICAGLDNMGGSDAGRLTNALTISGNRTTLGGKLGEATHQIALIELPTHQPAGTFTAAGTATGGLGAGSTVFLTHTAGTPQVTGTFTGTTQGADGGHNNAQPTHMVNKIIFTNVA